MNITATDVRKEIDKGNQSFMAVVRNGNADAFKNVYADDAVLMPSHTPAIQGIDGIKDFFGGAFKAGVNKAELVTVDLQASDDFAAETGKYKLFAGNTVADEGKYVVVWKKVGEDWRIYRDIFNSDLPQQ
jgi:ketosteroid isomerase-like protein